MYKYIERNITSSEIKTNLKNIGGKLVFWQAYKIDNTQITGDFAYIEANVDAGEYYITGKNMGKDFPLFILFDNNNNIIYYMGEENEFEALDYKIIIPNNVKKIVVNSPYNYGLPSIKKYISSKIHFGLNLMDNLIRD